MSSTKHTSLSLIDQFVNDARDDFQCPTTSTFFNRMSLYRNHVNLLSENVDFDLEGLQKLKKSVKSLHESGTAWNENEQELVSALDNLASVNASNAEDCDPEISAAWLKFSVIFKDLAKLTKSLVQSVKNNLVFPVDNLLKTDLKDRGEFRKPLDRALRDYDTKYARLEKDLKHSSRDGSNGRYFLSSSDIAEAMVKERTVLQYELCKYYHSISKTQSKKSSELLQHLIDFYHTQESFYREGLRTVEEFRCYVDALINQLNDVNRKQEEERKHLRVLMELFETSPYMKEMNEKIRRAKDSSPIPEVRCVNENADTSLSTVNDELPQETTLDGYLYKKSQRKMHRHWMKRKCEIREGTFRLWHSNESEPPRPINLLTCQVMSHKEIPNEFYIVSYERKYHFQAEDESSARRWVGVLKRNQNAVQNQTFHSETNNHRKSSTDRCLSPSQYSQNWQECQKIVIERIKTLPGNDRCCDCNTKNDITWLSTNLGSLHCIDCSGAHRDLGVHISRIQSLTLDNLEKPNILIALNMGNQCLNEIYEAAPSACRDKLSKNSTGNIRKSFISKKYAEKRYVKKPDDDGFSAREMLIEGAVDGSVKKILYALALGADVNYIDQETIKGSALIAAIRRDDGGSHLACVQALIQNGADVNLKDDNGDTPMHTCVRLNNPDCLKLVCLGRNLQLNVVSRIDGRTTLFELAKRLGHSKCEQVLIKALENDRSVLEDIELPILQLPFRRTEVDSDEASMSSSTLSAGGSSPRLPPPQPPPISLKPRIPSLHGEDGLVAMHKRSASDSSTGFSPMRGARLVLPPFPSSQSVVEGNGTSKLKAKQDSVKIKSLNSVLEPVAERISTNQMAPPLINEPPPKPAPRKAPQFKVARKCRALYDCEADNTDELCFRSGDEIIITKERLSNEDENWMEGYVDGHPEKLGVFPVTFVTFGN